MQISLVDKAKEQSFSYEKVKERSIISLINEAPVYISLIVGFRGRPEFLTPVIESFNNAWQYYKDNGGLESFSMTFVEHSKSPEREFFLSDKVNYIWTPGNVTEQYSRSFAYNFGVKYSNKAQYYILHDVDIIVKQNFFVELFENLGDSLCMQPYGGRRVLYLSSALTDSVLAKESVVDSMTEGTDGVSLPMFNGMPALGSKGGSIVIEHDLFFKVGGFDPELFWGYAAEDQMFWEKVLTVYGEVVYADNPQIDMFHMWHPPTSSSNPLLMEMESYFIRFKNMKKKERLEFIELKNSLLNEE